jgi:hypothetical protein
MRLYNQHVGLPMSCVQLYHSPRRGVIAILAVALLVLVVGLGAFAIDIGYISVVRSEIQRSVDSAALAGADALMDYDALVGAPNPTEAMKSSQAAVRQFASLNRVGGLSLVVPPGSTNSLNSDLVIGYVPDPSNPEKIYFDDPTRFNAVRVRLRRDDVANGPLGLFFAPILGSTQANVVAEATALFDADIHGFKASPDRPNPKLLPFTLHIDSWNNAFSSGSDFYMHDDATHTVTLGPDGIKELKLFPMAISPGNFGAIDIGAANNSTSVQERQILLGPDTSDFAYYPNSTLKLEPDMPLELNGNTGISAGVENELLQIIGQPRTLPLYSSVTGDGTNAQFTIVAFAGITVVDVNLNGPMRAKHITIQPCYVVDETAVHGGSAGVTSFFVRRPPSLVQ